MSGDARRESIVRAALPVFARLGRDGAGTDEIARAAGVSQPYVIRLFGGKDTLFLAVIDDLFDRISEALTMSQPAPTDTRLAVMLAAYRDVTDDPVIAHMAVQAVAASPDVAAAVATAPPVASVAPAVAAASPDAPAAASPASPSTSP